MRSVEAISDKNVKWEEGRREGMEDWKDGRMEDWKDGRLEGWKDGRLEGWRDGRMVSAAPRDRAPSRLGEIKIGDGTDVSAEALAKAEAIPP